ncbi:putative TRAM/LAG1/CLN8 domain-containing protein [Lupinus albus]|uniref:Putative TRAM/LAG1/CLN8 domain-containing protein n=1 Tax=Lupinus albus TaxID=3870 RepID=A0A6A4PA91_LUPAL|nr:putative TRAM/LAG1/CLN8 domain-containing protein [Lupinus albus]
MEDYVTKTIIVGVVSWTIAFVVARRIFPKCSFDFCNRIVSTIHATLAVTLASLSVEDWRCPICPMTSNSSHKQMQVMAVTLSYLIYDLVCCLFGERANMDNTIHHLVSIVGLGAGLCYQKVTLFTQIKLLFTTQCYKLLAVSPDAAAILRLR